MHVHVHVHVEHLCMCMCMRMRMCMRMCMRTCMWWHESVLSPMCMCMCACACHLVDWSDADEVGLEVLSLHIVESKAQPTLSQRILEDAAVPVHVQHAYAWHAGAREKGKPSPRCRRECP